MTFPEIKLCNRINKQLLVILVGERDWAIVRGSPLRKQKKMHRKETAEVGRGGGAYSLSCMAVVA